MFKSFRWRIALPYVVLIFLIMLGMGWYFSHLIRQTYLENLKAELISESRLAADNLQRELVRQNQQSPDLDALARRWDQMLGARITIIAPDGVVVGESRGERAQMDNHLMRPEVQLALREGTGVSTRRSPTSGVEMIYVAAAVYLDDQLGAIVRVAKPVEQVEREIARLQSTFIAAIALACILAILLAVWIANGATRPLRQLTEKAASVAEGALEPAEIETAPDEIASLNRAFNRMTTRLRAQINQLEEQRNQMTAVLNAMTDGVIIVDAQGCVELVNPAAERMFQITQRTAQGQSLPLVIGHHQIIDLWKSCRETSRGQSAVLELSVSHLFLQVTAAPLKPTPDSGSMLLFQNLTRQRYLETVRRDFVSNISHELRTPLASLKALTETLQSGALEDRDAARRFLKRMETEVDALTQMVSELLELSRIESGKVPLQFQPTPPKEIILATVERLRLQAERAGLALTVDCADDLPKVRADPPRLQQAMVNLLHNAIKFTPPGGKIHIGAFVSDQAGDQVIFFVKDTGIGIPEADLPRIFERFYKADRARSGGGTGLGLAIARHVVEAHQGKIWAESRLGEGSTFYFSIPSAAGAVPPEQAAS